MNYSYSERKKKFVPPYLQSFCDKIDIHTHLSKTEYAVEDRLHANSVLGFSRCVILPGTAERARPGRPMFLSEDACAVAREYPEDFAWLCNLLPDGTDATREKLLKYKEQGAKGVGEFGARFRFYDPRMEHMFSILEELDMCFLFHMSPVDRDPFYGILDDPRMPGLEGALQKFPGVKFIGHSQTFWFEIDKTDETDPDKRNSCPQTPLHGEGRITELMRKYPNLYGDLSAFSGQSAMLRDQEHAVKFMTEFQDRLMFGTDWGFGRDGQPFRFTLATWLDLMRTQDKLSDEAYRKICEGNALRLFFE